MTHDIRPRPGGRSARVRRAVLDATLDLLADPAATVTQAGVARRAGVQPSTVYRRWGSVASLVGEAVADRLAEASPLPDTGSLAGDVRTYVAAIAEDLAGPLGPSYLRAAALIGADPAAAGAGDAVSGRTAEIDAMLARARGRGAPCADAMTFFELVVGPLYGYALFAPAALRLRSGALADRFLAACAAGSSVTKLSPDQP